jgi:hypothetical protein
MDKQQQTRRLKPLKPILNPTLYQFILWITNQKWSYGYRLEEEDITDYGNRIR